MRQLIFPIAILNIALTFTSCQQTISSECRSVTESIYVNERFPNQIEQYHPDSLRVFTFEHDFNDSVAVSAANGIVARGYLVTEANGYAGRLVVRAQANEEIVISTTHSCARFPLKEGYKYLYINRFANKEWAVSYSNFSRGYF